MILEQNPALKRLVLYGLWHNEAVEAAVAAAAAAMTKYMLLNDTISSSSSFQMLTHDSSAVISSIRKGSGGLGNVVYSMVVGLTLAAYSSTRRLYATVYSDEAWKRYGGLFSAAVDDTFLNCRGSPHHVHHHECHGLHPCRCAPQPAFAAPDLLDDDYWPHSYFKYASLPGQQISGPWIKERISSLIVCTPWAQHHALTMIITQPVFPAGTMLSSPAGSVIREELGDALVTFMSHFLITPAPGLRLEIDSIVNGMRRSSLTEPAPFVIGIHMRWANSDIYQRPFHARHMSRITLSPADFDAFVDAAHVLAEGHPRVVFFIASDSLTRLLDLQEALSRPERAWSVVTANILTNVSDGSTADSIVDLFVLSHCDDLIVTHTSTFSHIAAALGGHRPVLVGAELSYRFGRQSLRRARTLDWTMPTEAWGVTLDLPFESWMSGGMSYGACEQAARCQGITAEAAAASVAISSSHFDEVRRKP